MRSKWVLFVSCCPLCWSLAQLLLGFNCSCVFVNVNCCCFVEALWNKLISFPWSNGGTRSLPLGEVLVPLLLSRHALLLISRPLYLPACTFPALETMLRLAFSEVLMFMIVLLSRLRIRIRYYTLYNIIVPCRQQNNCRVIKMVAF